MKNTSRNDILKIIAMVTMLIDHLGVLIFPELRILRTIGRIAFPIFAYQLALGYKNTSNRRSYRNKLLVFGLIAQVPYMFLNADLEAHFLVFNVLLFFWFATFALAAFEKAREYFRSDNINIGKILLGIFFSILTLGLALLPEIVHIQVYEFGLSYGTYGMLMILMFYLANQNPVKIIIGFLILSFIGVMSYGISILHHYSDYTYFQVFQHLDVVWTNVTTYNDGLRTLEGYFFQSRSLMAIPIIIGFEYLKPRFKINKKIGYYFYPVHIAILVILRVLLDMFA